MTEYSVEIQPDFLERQAKAQPIAAVAELIWNALMPMQLMSRLISKTTNLAGGENYRY
jgi:hypothetical protein